MKKIILITLLSLFSVMCYGQNSGALKFLGIPIDGTEAQFAAKLKSKGFTYSSVSESFKGQFNGKPVDVYIHTNHNLVDRVYVAFPTTSEEGIKVEFNRLLSQFNNNSKYLDLAMNEKIPDEDDISYEITVNNKRYQASFTYYDPDRDQYAFIEAFIDCFSGFFTPEQLGKMKEYAKKALDVPENQKEDVIAELTAEMQKMGLEQDENTEPNPEKALMIMATYLDGLHSLADGEVWFMIHEHYGRYQIGLYYDNLHNQAHGEDL